MEKCMVMGNIFGKIQDIGIRETINSILEMEMEDITIMLPDLSKDNGSEVPFKSKITQSIEIDKNIIYLIEYF